MSESWKSTFEAKVKAGLHTDYQDTIAAYNTKIAAYKADLEKLKSESENYIVTGGTDPDFLPQVEEIEKQIASLETKKAAVPYVKNMTREEYDGYMSEVADHYNPLIQAKFEALQSAYSAVVEVVAELQALEAEKATEQNYIADQVDELDGYRYGGSFYVNTEHKELFDKLTSTAGAGLQNYSAAMSIRSKIDYFVNQ